MRLLTMAVVVLVSTSRSFGGADNQHDERDLNRTAAPIQAELQEARQLKTTAPDRYVEESLGAATKLSNLADQFSTVSQSAGLRLQAVSTMMQVADFVRRAKADPHRAIAIYRQAAAIQKVQYEGNKLAMSEQIADIQEYDLHDYPAAMATMRAFHSRLSVPSPHERADYKAWNDWYRHWLSVEIDFLQSGKQYDGEVTSSDLLGFTQMLYFGAGREFTNGDSLGPEFNIFQVPKALSDTTKEKLSKLPPSHTMFLKTWMFAALLTSQDDAREWLSKNDRSGFWRACLLAICAVNDAGPTSNERELIPLSVGGRPTGFALLAREYAKHHQLPATEK